MLKAYNSALIFPLFLKRYKKKIAVMLRKRDTNETSLTIVIWLY